MEGFIVIVIATRALQFKLTAGYTRSCPKVLTMRFKRRMCFVYSEIDLDFACKCKIAMYIHMKFACMIRAGMDE